MAPFVGGIIGGAILHNKRLGWPWTQWIPLIFQSVGFIAQVLFLPETIFVRNLQEPQKNRRSSSFWFVFSRPFAMFRFFAVTLVAFWFGIAYMMHVGITAEIPLIFEAPPFNFTQLDVGLAAFSGLVGALLGEAFAGPILDRIALRSSSSSTSWKPELRLQAIWPALVTVPIGLVMFGVSIQYSRSWVPALVGQGVYIFGIEIATTVL